MSLLAKILDFKERQMLLTLGLSSLLEAKLQEFKAAQIAGDLNLKQQIVKEIRQILLDKQAEKFSQYPNCCKENANTNSSKQTDSTTTLAKNLVSKETNKNPIQAMFDIIEAKVQTSNSHLENDYDPLANDNLRWWQLSCFDWSKVDLNKCAVLYRTHSQSRAIEEVFLRYKVPYRLVSGVRFLDRKEVKDVLALLKFLANNKDKIALSRFLPLVLEGVGSKSLEKILAFLEDSNYPLPTKLQTQVTSFLQTIQQAWQNKSTLVELTKHLLNQLGYYNYLLQTYPNKEERQAREENIQELYSLMLPFDEDQNLSLPQKLESFLQQVSLLSSEEVNKEEQDQPKINLMTLHQSKGLEFETVFLVGCEEGLLPHQSSLLEESNWQEEVRLAYVGVTRAKKFLHLTAAASRIYFGQVRVNPISSIFRPFLGKYILQDI